MENEGISIAEILAENARLKAKLAMQKPGKLTLRVSDKGALSVYGLGKFPVTLYSSQWERLMDAKDDVVAFLIENSDVLKTKS